MALPFRAVKLDSLEGPRVGADTSLHIYIYIHIITHIYICNIYKATGIKPCVKVELFAGDVLFDQVSTVHRPL